MMGFLTEKLRARIEADCRKNEVADLTMGFIFDWADTTTDDTARALLEMVEASRMEVVGWDGQDAILRLTPAGQRHIKSLLKR